MHLVSMIDQVQLSLTTGSMCISMAVLALLLRPDWHDMAIVVGCFLCGTAIWVGFLCEEDWKQLSKMRSGAACHQEKTSDQ